jgi:copper transport protein
MRAACSIVAALLALCLAGRAHAHATLVSTDPGDNVVVVQAPKMVQLRFNEAVSPAAVRLIDAEGKTREVVARAVDQTVLIALPDSLPQGTQIISYRVVSQDGHPVGGSILFSVGAASRAAADQPRRSPLSLLIWLARIGVYLGLFAGVGGVFFATWIGQGRAGGTVIFGALYIGLASALVSFGLQGVDLLGLPPAGIFTAAPWKAAFETSLGPSLLLAIAAMLMARLAWRSPSRTMARTLAALSMAGAGSALAASGHAATASPQWLTRPSVFLHGIGVAYWVGALAPLAAMAQQSAGTLPSVLKRFSAVAVPIVALLALSGLVLACVQLESPSALIQTEYGVLLSIKLVLVALLLALAAYNRYRLTPALDADATRTGPLLRSVLTECLLALLILAVVAGWRFTPPPRALAAATDAPRSIHIHTDAAMLQVLIAPGKVGPDDFMLQLMAGDFSPLAAREVTLTLSLPERGVEALERKAVLDSDGNWHVRNVTLPVPGRWHMRIDALVTDFQQVTLEDDFDLR